MYSHSKKWVSDEQKQRDKLKAVNKTRNRMFPKSFAWPPDYDLEVHNEEMSHLKCKRDWDIAIAELNERKFRRRNNLPDLPPIRAPMQAEKIMPGNDFPSAHGAVLALPTVFTPSFEKTSRPIAPWPCKEELFHEGDYRISNEKHLRRMLPAPRVDANDTVVWSKRSYLEPHPLDDFRVFRNGVEQTEKFTHTEELEILGLKLSMALEPHRMSWS